MINANKIKTYPLRLRKNKVNIGDFAKVPLKKNSFKGFYGSLPNILKAKDLRAVVETIIKAHRQKRAVIFMCGAHVIKCGLNPVLIELIKKKIITCIVLNGAGIIHDFEIALQGSTSEEVGEGLKKGKFGMARETADFLNSAIKEGVSDGLGLGCAVAKKISGSRLRYKNMSLAFNSYRHNVPLCVFVAIGTDIIHQHSSFDAALTGEGSLRDFRQLVECVCQINKGGAVLNFGSAVILPEVFLKALNLARNLGTPVKDFMTVNFDMLYQYRSMQNIVSRPVMESGKGYYIIGHHEIMLPLLAQAIIERL